MADADKGGTLHQEFKAAAHEIDARRPPVEPEEKPFVSELDKLEAEREALTKSLDEQVLSGKIDRHEMRYQLQRFENEPLGGKKPQLKFFEDKEKERMAAGSQEPKQTKGHGENRGPGFFEDRNNDQDRER